MKVLVVGGGGREHALCWKLAQSERQPKLYCAPGNAGTAATATNVAIEGEDTEALLAFAKSEGIDLTVVGPEDPLCAGIVDRFEAAGLKIFGPCAGAARLEGDKAYAKHLMRLAGVPTAEVRVFGPTKQELAQLRQAGRDGEEAVIAAFQRGYDMARQYVVTRDEGVVVKAAGLAKGKGVFVHPDPSAALLTLEDLMVKRSLGEAGDRVLIEELLTGPEVSVLALVDGRTLYVLEPAADYKRLGDGDAGPNTGGMGAYCPATTLSDRDMAAIERDILVPIVDALRQDGTVYRGVLYAGLMLTTGGPKVLEFNCRFGDPETQPTLMRLRSDLVDVLTATVDGRLDQTELEWDSRRAVCVVVASEGYPGRYVKGKKINGLEAAARLPDVQVFHAGAQLQGDKVVTAGGRVLGVTALGKTFAEARKRAYEAAELVSFDGARLRRDIAASVA
jgi:phosphoribosylamine--glycine ligase